MNLRSPCVPAALLLAVLAAGRLDAHSFDPILLDVRQIAANEFEVRMVLPEAITTRRIENLPAPIFESGCNAQELLESPDPSAPRVWRLSCEPAAAAMGVSGLEGLLIDAFVRVRETAGGIRTTVLRGSADRVVLTRPVERGTAVFARYVAAGIEHILTGYDHLAFVAGLLLLINGWIPLVKAVTAFTLAHSVTLLLATIDVLRLPSPPVEALIMLSIAFVAAEACREGEPTLTRRVPWVVAFAFGLLHGLGFAGALLEAGLPRTHLPAALFAFNLGIEAGQLLFVAVLVCASRLVRTAAMPRLRIACAYALGSVAMAWLIGALLGTNDR